MIVVDVGCHTHARYPSDESVHRLIREFQPSRLYGYDPHPDMPEFLEQEIGGTRVQLARLAAWTHGGTIPYDARPDRPLAASVGWGDTDVPCFDLAAMIRYTILKDGGPLVLKLDVEGSEYPLLEHLLGKETDRLLARLLVEWHAPPIGPSDWEERRDALLPRLVCPVEPW